MAFRHASHQASSRSAGSYRVQEFARLAGVTVRALHHYDRLKLLTPARSRAGYRLYRDSDLARLEQIVVLKFIGVPLTEIRRLLKRELPLPAALGRQRQVLAHKRDRIDAAMQAIEAAGRSVRGQSADWDLFKTIVKEVQMQNDTDWTKKYYSPEAREAVDERRPLWSPELQARVTAEWTALVADVEAALGEDPAGAAAQALAARWRTLVGQFTGGDPETQKGLNRMWSDRANWPASERARFEIKPEVQAFIVEAMTRGT